MSRSLRLLLRLAVASGLAHLLIALSRRRVRVLMYHGVCAGPRADAPFGGRGKHVAVADFERQMAWLARHMQPISIEALVSRLETGTALPSRGVVVTIDDGYRNNHDSALPILMRHRIPATVYVTTGFVEGCPFWVDRIDAAIEHRAGTSLDLRGTGIEEVLPLVTTAQRLTAAASLRALGKRCAAGEREDLVRRVTARAGLDLADLPEERRPRDIQSLTPEMLRTLARCGVAIGSHTQRHESLRLCPDDLLEAETVGSRRRLEEWLEQPVLHFAYPNGRPEDFDERTEEAVRKAGYRSALTTVRGAVEAGDSPWRIRRVPVNGGEGFVEFLADLSGLRPFLLRVRNGLRARLRPAAPRGAVQVPGIPSSRS